MAEPNSIGQSQLSQEQVRRASHEAAAKRAAEARDEWRRRWYLSLAIGNAGGAVGLTSAVVSRWGASQGLPVSALLAGLWFFALGLLAAGTIPLLIASELEARRASEVTRANDFPHGHSTLVYWKSEDPIDADDLRAKLWNGVRLMRGLTASCQIASAAAFTLGVLVPLIWLSFLAASPMGASRGEQSPAGSTAAAPIGSK